MMRSILIGVTLSMAIACSTETDATPREDQLAVAKQLAQNLGHGLFTDATRDFNDEMKAALAAEKLGKTWGSMVERFGPLRSLDGARGTTVGEYQVIYIHGTHEHGELDIRVVFNGGTQVGGLWFRPPDSAKHYESISIAVGGAPAEASPHVAH